LVLVADGSPVQVFLGIIVCTVYQCMHLHAQPLKRWEDNLMQEMAGWHLLSTLITGMWISLSKAVAAAEALEVRNPYSDMIANGLLQGMLFAMATMWASMTFYEMSSFRDAAQGGAVLVWARLVQMRNQKSKRKEKKNTPILAAPDASEESQKKIERLRDEKPIKSDELAEAFSEFAWIGSEKRVVSKVEPKRHLSFSRQPSQAASAALGVAVPPPRPPPRNDTAAVEAAALERERQQAAKEAEEEEKKAAHRRRQAQQQQQQQQQKQQQKQKHWPKYQHQSGVVVTTQPTKNEDVEHARGVLRFNRNKLARTLPRVDAAVFFDDEDAVWFDKEDDEDDDDVTSPPRHPFGPKLVHSPTPPVQQSAAGPSPAYTLPEERVWASSGGSAAGRPSPHSMQQPAASSPRILTPLEAMQRDVEWNDL
jgi:hypothetical protein